MSARENATYEEVVAALPDELFRSWTDPEELKICEQKIEPDRRLVYTWIWAHTPTEVMRVHVDFEAVAADRTRIVIRHADITDGELRRYELGWREGVARLRQLVKS